jgi:hypothetical protein
MDASVQNLARHAPSWRELSARRAAFRETAALLPLAAGILAWVLSLQLIRPYHLGRYGLAPALPVAWYGALALLVAGAVGAIWLGDRAVMAGLYIAAIVAVLYATVPAVTSVPHYAWVYKHIGVTRLISDHGGVPFAGGDIYSRWPAFFAGAAVLSNWAGIDPLAVAAWAEPFFALVDALLVAAVAHAISRDARVAGFSALVFTLGSWVGQAYFAPQAAAYTLAFLLLLVFVRAFAGGELAPWVRRLTERVVRRPQPGGEFAAELPWSRGTSLAIVLAVDAVIVATHQLTPYVIVLELGALTVLGVARPRWLVAATATIAVLYLVANIGYITRNYPLFTGLNPSRNIQGGSWGAPHVDWLDANAGGVLSAVLILLMLASTLRLTRIGLGYQALPLLALALAPFGILLAQNYGGEASLRVFLFSSPWRDILIALGVAAIPGRRVRALAAGAVCLLLSYLFVAAFYGEEEFNVFRSDEVAAGEYFYDHAPSGSVLLLAAPDFPTKVGPRYTLMKGTQAEDGLNIAATRSFEDRPLGRAQVPAVISLLRQYSPRGYVAFSTTQYRFAAIKELTAPGALGNLERAIASSTHFHLWYVNRDTRIYELGS